MTDAHPSTTLLRSARIVLPERTLDAASLLIEDGSIARILDSSGAMSHAESIIDLNGCMLFPGFIDLHIHGAIGVDVMNASAKDLGKVAEFLARKGLTAWMPTLVPVPAEEYERAVEAIGELIEAQNEEQAGSLRSKDRSQVGARAVGVHYEGPFVNAEQCGALHREHFRVFLSAADLDSLPTVRDEKAVHMMTLAPEIEGGIELVRELVRRAWVVSIGHTRAGIEVLEKAFEAGARHMTHFMNAMPRLHHRAPGPVGWGLSRDDVTCDLIADGIHLDSLVLRLLVKWKTPERLALISDAIAAAGKGDGEYRIWGETITVSNGRTRNARGTIAGSVTSMLDEVRSMLSLGVPEPEVARMASLNPAGVLKLDRDRGSIEEGKRADLVALDERLSVRMTVIGGEISHSLEQ